MRLRLDRRFVFLQAALPVDLGLVLDALALRLGDTASLAEDLLGLPARLADQSACSSSRLRASLRACSASSSDRRIWFRRASIRPGSGRFVRLRRRTRSRSRRSSRSSFGRDLDQR